VDGDVGCIKKTNIFNKLDFLTALAWTSANGVGNYNAAA